LQLKNNTPYPKLSLARHKTWNGRNKLNDAVPQFNYNTVSHFHYRIQAGIDLNTVRELMGHKSLAMTLRYAHLSPDHKKRAVEILDTQMDTIWTPEQNKEKKAENLSLQRIENIGSYDNAPVAQLDRVVDFESKGWAFESPRARQISKLPIALVV